MQEKQLYLWYLIWTLVVVGILSFVFQLATSSYYSTIQSWIDKQCVTEEMDTSAGA